jgi:hypothetical protein
LAGSIHLKKAARIFMKNREAQTAFERAGFESYPVDYTAEQKALEARSR